MSKMIHSAVDEQLSDVIERIDALEAAREKKGEVPDADEIEQMRADIVVLQEQIEERTLLITQIKQETSIALTQLTETRNEMVKQLDVKIDWEPLTELTNLVVELKKQISDTRSTLARNEPTIRAAHSSAKEANGEVQGLKPEVEEIKQELLKLKGLRGEGGGGGEGGEAIGQLRSEINGLKRGLKETMEKESELEAMVGAGEGRTRFEALRHDLQALQVEVSKLKVRVEGAFPAK
jgi:chromosome segregation ATPase